MGNFATLMTGRTRGGRWVGLWLMLLLSMVGCPAAERPRVLVLFSNDRLLPANQEIERGLRRAFSGPDGEPKADLFGEFIDAVRFPEPDLSLAMERFLKDRHRSMPPAVCVTVGPQALDFMMRHRDEIFPGVPVVFGGVTVPQAAALPERTDLTGRPMDWSIKPLLEKLPELRPAIRNILIVTGAAEFDEIRRAEALPQIEPFQSRYGFQTSHGEPLERVLERVSKLPDDTLVFYLTYFRTPDGRAMVPGEVAARLAKASSVPVVCVFDTYIGTGVLGGPVMPFEEEGFAIGGIARRIIDGEDPSEIGVLPSGTPRLMFDERAMKRFGWSAASLPEGAEIRFRTPSLWEAHKTGVLTGSGVLAVQSALILGLLAARARQRSAENERRLSESRFTGVFAASPVSISIIRQSDGRLVDVNPAWERTTGVAREVAVGRTHLEMGFVFEGAPGERFREYLASGKPLRDFEQRLRMPDGKSRLLSVSTELLDLRGEPCYVSMAQDITDRQEAEDARQRLAQSSRLGMLGELTASIAHEVNQPLGAILSNAEAAEILLGFENPQLDEIRAILADIRRDDLRAGEVIRQVRSMVAREEVHMVPLDPGALATGVAGLIRHDCKRRGIALDSGIAANLPLVRGAKVQLEQVLLNLLLNSMDALKDPASHDKKIRISVESTPDGRVDIAVADTGPGIAPDVMPKLFDNFFTTKESGMGLGLALSRSIAESHSGCLVAENAPNGGAVFHFILPPMP
jgi:PAS domain S-box-containing protein